MAAALRPALFDPEHYQGYTSANPSPVDLVELFDRNYRFNPVDLLTDDDRAMLQIWAMRRSSGGMAGGPLPEDGGLMDQAAIMMEALQLMDGAAAEIQEEERERAREARGKPAGTPA